MSKPSISTQPTGITHKHLLSLLLLGMTALSFTTQVHAEAADRDKPIDLEADSVKVDDAKQTSTYSGRVILTQGTLVIHADKLIVREDKEGFQHSTSLGNPTTFRQKREGKDEYMEGSAQRIEYDGRMDKVQLYTKAWVKRGEDIVHGDYIMYDASAEYAEVIGGGSQAATPATPSGRVRAIIQPKNKKGTAPTKNAPATTPATSGADTEVKPDTSSKSGSPSANTTANNDAPVKNLRFSRSLQVSPEAKP
jgi:lipopolysaccharide export system protein LptA